MKIFIIHGYKSSRFGNLDRISALSSLGEVKPLGYKSDKTREEILEVLRKEIEYAFCENKDPDETFMIVGASLGGYFANELASSFKSAVPVLLNPCCDPHKSLGLPSFEGKPLRLDHENFGISPYVMLTMDDEVFDYSETLDYFKGSDSTNYVFPYGSHRFNIDETKYEAIKAIIDNNTH